MSEVEDDVDSWNSDLILQGMQEKEERVHQMLGKSSRRFGKSE